MFSKKKKYRINPAQASDTLQNVFAQCEQTPNTVPFGELMSREQQNAGFFNRMIILTAILLLLTFLAPLAAIDWGGAFPRERKEVALVSDTYEDGLVCIRLSGDGILYEEAYQEFSDGSREAAVSYDKNTSSIRFTYYTDRETNIYVPVTDAPAFHLLVSPQ